MKLAVLLLAIVPLAAQVKVTVSAVSKDDAKALFNSRFAKRATPWLVGLENASADRVLVKPSAVTNRIGELGPLDSVGVGLLVEEASRNSIWARLGRVVLYGGEIYVFVKGSGVGPLNATWQRVLTGASAIGPTAIQIFNGAQAPIAQNATRLVWNSPIDLQPGDTASVYVYTRPWSISNPAAQKREFVIDISQSRTAKLAQ